MNTPNKNRKDLMEKELQLFKDYVNQFDMNDENIIRKYEHSLRVMNFAKEISKSLNMKERDIYLCSIIGLLHDIGRFTQWTKYHTFSDMDSIDHGDLGVELLKENEYIKKYIQDDKEIEIVLESIRNHNKYKMDANMKENIVTYAKIIRDADKIDIMETQCNNRIPNGIICSDGFLRNIEKKELLYNGKVINQADLVVRMLCFLFDMHYPYTYQYIIRHDLISKKIELLEEHVPDSKDLVTMKHELRDYVYDKLNKEE